MKKLKELAPHEKEILGNEFLKEELIQKRLEHAIAYDMQKRTIKNLGGLEGMAKIFKQLEEHGLTPEKANEMSPDEFAKFLEEHDIKV
jgi:uncharacterized protein YutE (UPF0331/DUF86 family)